MTKVIVCSIPKSGTYLVAEIVKQLGFRATNLHLGTHEFADYGAADLETGRRNPGQLIVSELIESSINRVRDGEFAVGHLPIETAPLLSGFRVVFVCRNVRDVLISFCRWIAATGRDPDGGNWRELQDGPDKLLGFLERRGEDMYKIVSLAQDWHSTNQMPTWEVTFEELMGDFGKSKTISAMRRIADATDRRYSDADLLWVLQKAKSADTLTRSTGRTNRRRWWNRAVEREYRRRGFFEINKRLGYKERRIYWPWKSAA